MSTVSHCRRPPDQDFESAFAPAKSIGMRMKVQIDMVESNGGASIFNTPVSIARYIHQRAEGEHSSVCSDHSAARAGSRGGDSDRFGLAALRAGNVHRASPPCSFPPTTFSARAVPCCFKSANRIRRALGHADTGSGVAEGSVAADRKQ